MTRPRRAEIDAHTDKDQHLPVGVSGHEGSAAGGFDYGVGIGWKNICGGRLAIQKRVRLKELSPSHLVKWRANSVSWIHIL